MTNKCTITIRNEIDVSLATDNFKATTFPCLIKSLTLNTQLLNLKLTRDIYNNKNILHVEKNVYFTYPPLNFIIGLINTKNNYIKISC